MESTQKKTDLWSLGSLYYELLVGYYPFLGKTELEIKKKMIKGDYEFTKNIKISSEGMHVISECL